RTDRGLQPAPARFTKDALSVIEDPSIPIIIELIGGYEPARRFVLAAIRAGKDVVTANKALLAVHGDEIVAAAEARGVRLGFEASVGGGIPILRTLKEGLAGDRTAAVYGIVNGTCNHILTTMTREGRSFGDVLADAQRLGLAEADGDGRRRRPDRGGARSGDRHGGAGAALGRPAPRATSAARPAPRRPRERVLPAVHGARPAGRAGAHCRHPRARRHQHRLGDPEGPPRRDDGPPRPPDAPRARAEPRAGAAGDRTPARRAWPAGVHPHRGPPGIGRVFC